MTNEPTIIEKGVDKDELAKLLADNKKEIIEALTPMATPKSETELLDPAVETDYRKALVENLTAAKETVNFQWRGREDNEDVAKLFPKTKVPGKLQETIGAVTATNVI